MTRAFQVGQWHVEPDRNRLSRAEAEVRIEPKVMEVFVFLCSFPGEVLSKERIRRAVWGDIHVSDEVLTYSISELRKALGDNARKPLYVETISKRGYRVIAPVTGRPEGGAEASAIACQPAATNPAGGRLRIGDWLLKPETNCMSRNGEAVQLEPRLMQFLIFLAQYRNELVTRDRILDTVWAGTTCSEDVVIRAVDELRSVLGDDESRPRYIRTESPHGYRLIAAVSLEAADDTSSCVASGHSSTGTRRTPRALWYGIVATASVILLTLGMRQYESAPALTESDWVLLGDVANGTGEPIFDEMLRHGLAIHLEQSPFLNLYPEARARETLRYMGRPTDAQITTEVAREICQRRGIKALIVGSINPLGANYVISLEAINGHTGDVIARELIEVQAKERVLRAVGQVASRLRKTLGESLPSIQKYDVPLEQATTPSLEAFKAYSLGRKLFLSGRLLEAVPHYERAVHLDPGFASAYDDLTYCYRYVRKARLAAETAEKALSLSDKVTEYERGSIKVAYYFYTTEEIGRAVEVLESMRAVYPRSATVTGALAGAYHQLGALEKAEALFNESLALPGDPLAGLELAAMYLAQNRIEEAKVLLQQHESDNLSVRMLLFHLAVLEGDLEGERQQTEWAKGRADECFMLARQMHVSALRGQMRQARDECRRAMELARRRNLAEASIEFSLSLGRTEALLGNPETALAAVSDVTGDAHWQNCARSALILALSGRAEEARRMIEDALQQAPKATLLNEWWRPNVEAALALARGDGRSALRALEPAAQFDPVAALSVTFHRGEANLLLRDGRAAAAEFRRIVNDRARVIPSVLYPLAHIGLARALVLSGDPEHACEAYRGLFAFWKEADRDLPALLRARAEHAAICP